MQQPPPRATCALLAGRSALLAWGLLFLAAAGAPAQQEYRPLRTGGLDAESAALLISGQEGGSIPLFAVAVPGVAEAGGKATVELFVEVPGGRLLAGHEGETVRVELCLYALRGSSVAGAALETVELDLSRDGERLLAGGIKLRSTLELAAGEYVLRLLARNVQTGELGLRSHDLEVPAAESAAPTQSLLVPDPTAGWLRLTRSGEPPAIGFWPAARPVLAPDADAELLLLLRGREPDTARLEIGGAAGEALEVPAAVTPTDSGAPAGFDRWLVRARIPALEPGDYELRLQLAGVPVSRRLPVLVRSGGGVWPAAGQPSRPTAPAAGEAAAAPAPGRGRDAGEGMKNRLAAEYRGALSLLAAGDGAGAAAELERVESAAFELEGGPAVLVDAENQVAKALHRKLAAGLPPLFDLHYRSYQDYLRDERFQLSSHARERLFDLIDLYLGAIPGNPAPATDMLVVMANQLQRSGMARFSSVIFNRALHADPDHEGALLGLAAGREKHGDFSEACNPLRRLLDSQPDHREARLRLAVNLARTGNRAKGRRLLRELVESPTADWILAVAYQELARELMRSDRLDEAQGLLEEGRQRLPDDDQLPLLLAAVADARQVGGSRHHDELVPRSRAGRPSARHRYQEWPRFVRDAEEQTSSRRLEALAAFLQEERGTT